MELHLNLSGESCARAVGALGIVGAIFAVACFAAIVSSPGDDNPIALVAFFAAALSFVPARGLWAPPTHPLRMVLWLLVAVPPLVLDGLLASLLLR